MIIPIHPKITIKLPIIIVFFAVFSDLSSFDINTIPPPIIITRKPVHDIMHEMISDIFTVSHLRIF